VRAALRAGADGYLIKDSTPDEFLMALASVALGKKYLSPDVSAHVVDSFLNPHQSGQPASRLEQLTTRERSILQLIAEGRTNRRAAEYLSVSPKTVEKHRASLMHKLGLINAAEITLVALEMGLIERPMPLARLARGTAGLAPSGRHSSSDQMTMDDDTVVTVPLLSAAPDGLVASMQRSMSTMDLAN
jgi:DNA-binding CsgD family transcriptional regulator